MKKFGIAALFAMILSAGLWAEPADSKGIQLEQLSSSNITSVLHSDLPTIPSDSIQLMSSSSARSTAEDTLIDLIVEILGYIWGYNNLGVTYDAYPYATSPRYMCFEATQGYFDLSFPDHFWRFGLDTSFFDDIGLWMGNSTRFEGFIWKFFGPVVELNSYFNTKEGNIYLANSGYKGNVRVGGSLSLVQTNPFSALFYMQWNHYINIPLEDSLALGFILRSYPIKPVLLEWRVNWQFLQEFEKAFFESHLEVGAMVTGPLEIFAAWNFKSYPGFEYKGHGFEAGARVHF